MTLQRLMSDDLILDINFLSPHLRRVVLSSSMSKPYIAKLYNFKLLPFVQFKMKDMSL